MKIVGIVTEYNPFHLGHKRQIETLRALFGADSGIVCCMSGNYVQRGEPALLDKWRRAELALHGGADLILELPTLWAVSSAQFFARGAVGLLEKTGAVDVLAFGSECGDLDLLTRTAACLEREEYRLALRGELAKGLSFAAARERAVRACIGKDASCLQGANDILAVEYLSALHALGSAMEPVAIARVGASHDGGAQEGVASASHIRALLREGEDAQAYSFLPEEGAALLRDAPRSDPARCERAVLGRLRAMTEADFAALPDCGEGLHRRLMEAVRKSASLEEVLRYTKTKRYPLARIRRAVLWAFLGRDGQELPPAPPYLKVLGFTGRGREILRSMKRTAALPVLTKPAHGKALEGPARAVLEREAVYTDLYALTLPEPGPCGREWTQNPVRVERA